MKQLDNWIYIIIFMIFWMNFLSWAKDTQPTLYWIMLSLMFIYMMRDFCIWIGKKLK